MIQNKVDLIFLDIQMDSFTGIQFMESLNIIPQVIITSAYSKYAIDGFNFNVTDFLLKPFSFERFIKSVDRVQKKLSSISDIKVQKKYFFVKSEYKMERIDFSSILYIKGMKDYLQIVTATSKIMTLQSFVNMATQLPKNNFVRVHKSYIVALDKIKHVEKNYIEIDNYKIPIGLSYKSNFYSNL